MMDILIRLVTCELKYMFFDKREFYSVERTKNYNILLLRCQFIKARCTSSLCILY